LFQIKVFGKTQSGIRGSSISKNYKQRFFHFIKTWGFFSIAICCPLSERRFTGSSMVEGNFYNAKFMILSLD
jgi:hypothetical protein